MLLVKLCVLLEEKRDPEQSLRWLFEINDFTEECIDRQAIAWGNGVHMKHKVMDGIHDFFCERVPPGSMVLDVGCGIGALANEIAQSVDRVQVTGIDYNAEHIQFAKERYSIPNLQFFQGDATLDLPEQSVDIIILSSVLEHITDRTGFLSALIRAYHPKGFLIRVPTCEQHFHAAMKRNLGIFCYIDRDHKTEYTLNQFHEEINSAGLGVNSLEIRWGDIWAECCVSDNEI
ncbi:MAG: class I SAM-dependent methyltransferase [Proteobacteria bacterium]|nr:class I SAM-dependent methyltransferase [Pseudomonadota bacterium]